MKIEYNNDVDGSRQEAQGSDGRLNTSSRSDGRPYYNSRDLKKTFTAVYNHQSAVEGEFSAYIQNTSTTDDLVIVSIGLNGAQSSRIKLHLVTGTAAGGSVVTPLNPNAGSSKAASASCLTGNQGDAITGITSSGVVDFVAVQQNGHEKFRSLETLRLGQNDAIALEYHEGATGDFFGAVVMYYEKSH